MRPLRGEGARWSLRRPGTSGGFVTIQFVAASGLALVLLTLVANLIVWQYARGVLRAAIDEGARAGSRAGSGMPECVERGDALLDDLLGGSLRSSVELECEVVGERIIARGEAILPAWLPGFPDLELTLRATATREAFP